MLKEITQKCNYNIAAKILPHTWEEVRGDGFEEAIWKEKSLQNPSIWS
jgi:hypothetical protein